MLSNTHHGITLDNQRHESGFLGLVEVTTVESEDGVLHTENHLLQIKKMGNHLLTSLQRNFRLVLDFVLVVIQRELAQHQRMLVMESQLATQEISILDVQARVIYHEWVTMSTRGLHCSRFFYLRTSLEPAVLQKF